MGARGVIPVVVLLAAAGSLGLGCEAVPDLTFVPDEGGIDGGARDSGPASDAASEGGDAGPSGCTTPSPAAGAVCCGSAWCQDCTQANCDECVRKACSGGNLCCPTGGTVTCKSRCK